jgi:hypothetical protein
VWQPLHWEVRVGNAYATDVPASVIASAEPAIRVAVRNFLTMSCASFGPSRE